MRKTSLFFHLFAFAALVGSIFAHIVLGAGFQPDLNMVAYTNSLAAKNLLTSTLIFAGLTLSVASGVGLIWARASSFTMQGWLKTKLVLVVLVILNAVFFLAPIGQERAAIAAESPTASSLPEHFAALGLQEDLFGAGNLLLVLIIGVLSIRKRLYTKK